MTGDDWLRDVLDDAVGNIEPSERLDVIRARTTTEQRRRTGSRWVAAAAGLAVAATVATFAVLETREVDRGGPGPSETPTATVGTVAVPVYYTGDTPQGARLYREFHRVPDDGREAERALAAALEGEPLDPDYSSAWKGRGVEVTDVTSAPGLITVDLSGPPSQVGPTDQLNDPLAIQQLIYTVQGALQSTNQVPVQLLYNGEQVTTLAGVDVSAPLLPQPALEVLSTVSISSPQEGEVVGSGATVSGRGAFNEANVAWELLDGERVVTSGFTTAEECCRLAPYTFTLDAPPGSYTLRVYDASLSGDEDAGEVEDTRHITIR